jgi:hypothetical protein
MIWPKSRSTSNNALPSLKTALMAILLILYGAAAFAKLNPDFVSSDVTSCAIELHNRGFGQYLIFPHEYFPLQWTILIAALELSVPFLLLFKKTRRIGIAFTLVFHLIVSAHPNVPGLAFTFVLVAFLALFLSYEELALIRLAISRILKNAPSSLRNSASVRLLTVAIFSAAAVTYFSNRPVGTLHLLIFHYLPFGILLAVTVVAIYTSSKISAVKTPSIDSINLQKRAHIGFVIVSAITSIFLVSLPYVGLSTLPVMTMYSNLETTKGNWNHFILPERGWIGPQDYNYVVIKTSRAELEQASQERILNIIEIRRFLSGSEDPELELKYVGHGSENREVTASASKELSFLESKFLRFRALDQGKGTCQW